MSIDISAYVANNVLDLLHNSFRLSKGGNEVLLPVELADLLNSSEDVSIPTSPSALFDSPEGAYYKGLATSSIALIVVFVLWVVALPFVGLSTRCKKLCPDFLKLICVIFGLIMAMLALFISVKGNNLLNDGTAGLVSDGTDATDAVNDISAAMLDLKDKSFGYDLGLTQLNAGCGTEASSRPGLEAALLAVTTGDDVRDALQPLIDTAADLNDTLNTTIEDVSPLLDSVGSGYKAITGVLITFLGVFLITIVLRYAEHKGMISEESKLAKCVTCFNKFQLGLLFTVGLIFIIILIVVCAILGPVSTLGADLCVPDASSNILTITADASGLTGDPLNQCFIDAADIRSLSDVEILGNTACYYTQCKGVDAAFIDDGIFINDTEAKSDLLDQIAADFLAIGTQAAISGATSCSATLNGVSLAVLAPTKTATEEAILLARCEIVTPIVRSMLDVQVCNNLVSGLGVIFVTWTTAVIGLMLTVLCACCIDLKTPTEEAAKVLEEKQEMKGDGGAQMEAMSL